MNFHKTIAEALLPHLQTPYNDVYISQVTADATTIYCYPYPAAISLRFPGRDPVYIITITNDFTTLHADWVRIDTRVIALHNGDPAMIPKLLSIAHKY